MPISSAEVASVVALALAVSFCAPSPTPCLRNTDCASMEYCASGACLLKSTTSGDAAVVVTPSRDATLSTGAGGAPAAVDAKDEGDTVSKADAPNEAEAASDAADVSSEADVNGGDGTREADAVIEAEAGAE